MHIIGVTRDQAREGFNLADGYEVHFKTLLTNKNIEEVQLQLK